MKTYSVFGFTKTATTQEGIENGARTKAQIFASYEAKRKALEDAGCEIKKDVEDENLVMFRATLTNDFQRQVADKKY